MKIKLILLLISFNIIHAHKVFLVTEGQVSGDNLARWYIEKKYVSTNTMIEGICGASLADYGISVLENKYNLRFTTALTTGLFSFLTKIPSMLESINKTVDYIVKNNFDEVVLVDFPMFNVPLVSKLKNKNNKIKITYLAPPELWVWGKWNIDKILKRCNTLIVLYPHEVNWYKSIGIDNAIWMGYPYLPKLKKYQKAMDRKFNIALMPGTRKNDIESLMPAYSRVISLLKAQYQNIGFVIPVSKKDHINLITKFIDQNDPNIKIYENEDDKFEALSNCFMAITKPGTSTLELAILKIPSLVAYKVSTLGYVVAKLLIQAQYITLPNLILNKEIYKELIQSDCTSENIHKEADTICKEFLYNQALYLKRISNLDQVEKACQLDSVIKQSPQSGHSQNSI